MLALLPGCLSSPHRPHAGRLKGKECTKVREQGRARGLTFPEAEVLLTRVMQHPPFVQGEAWSPFQESRDHRDAMRAETHFSILQVIDKFPDNETVIQTLCASCCSSAPSSACPTTASEGEGVKRWRASKHRLLRSCAALCGPISKAHLRQLGREKSIASDFNTACDSEQLQRHSA